MIDLKLKPCPFCGEAVEINRKQWVDSEGYADDMIYVDCQNHNMIIRPDDWNNRPAEDGLRAEIERLKGILSGDPNLTETKEQREEWRLSAVRYGDKVEAENERLREALNDILVLPIEHDNDTLQSIRRIAMIVKIARAALDGNK